MIRSNHLSEPLRRVAATKPGPYVLLSLLAFVLYLPGIAAIPPTDRDEARFAQASRQMVETGDYVRIYFQDEPRHKKPAGAYWLQTLSVRGLSDPTTTSIWPYRIPSVVAAWGSLIALFALLSPIVGRSRALLGALVMGSTAVLVAEAHLAKADAPLFFCVVVAMSTLGRAYARPDALPVGLAYLMWAACAGGLLVKGPVLPAIFGLSVLSLLATDGDRAWLKRLRPGTGLVLAAGIALPWFIAVQRATDGAFVGDALSGDILPKFFGVHESHGGPPGYYALLSFATFWPWSLAIVPAAFATYRSRNDRATRFLLSWLLPCWLILELAPTKLPHYSMPLYPALAMLVAGWLLREGDSLFWPNAGCRPACGWGRPSQGGDEIVIPAKAGIQDPREAAATGWIPASAGMTSTWDEAEQHHGGGCLETGASRLGIVLWTIVSIALAAVFLGGSVYFDGRISLAGVCAAGAVGISLGVAWRSSFAARNIVRAAVVASLAFPLFMGLLFPSLQSFWLSERVANEAIRLRGEEPVGPLIIAGFREPSLVFLTGTKTLLASPEEAAAQLVERCDALVVVSRREGDRFREALRSLGGSLSKPAASVQGFNYSKGKHLVLDFFAAEACDA